MAMLVVHTSLVTCKFQKQSPIPSGVGPEMELFPHDIILKSLIHLKYSTQNISISGPNPGGMPCIFNLHCLVAM